MVKRKLTKKAKKAKAKKTKKRGGEVNPNRDPWNPFDTPFFTQPINAVRDWGNSVPGVMTNFGEDIGKAFQGRQPPQLQVGQQLGTFDNSLGRLGTVAGKGKKRKSKKGRGGVKKETPKMKANKFRQEIVNTFKGKGNTRGYTLPKFPKGKGIFPGSRQGNWDISYRNAINQGYSHEEATRAANAFNGPRGGGIFPGSHQGDWDRDYRNAINQGYSPEAATRAANAFNGPR